MNIEQRLLVNSCLEKLVASEGKDEEAAKTAISLLHQIPLIGRFRIAQRSGSKKSNSVTALTNEIGNITVSDENKGAKTTHLTPEPERIGNYRIHRPSEGMLVFAHFQDFERSIFTDSEVLKFAIEYNPHSLEYNSFFSITKKVYRVRIFSYNFGVTNESLNLIYKKGGLHK